MNAGALMDGTLLVMLAITIGFCIRLNRRIHVVKESKREMALLCKRLEEIIDRAQHSIHELKNTSEYVGKNIEKNINRAQHSIQELSLVNDRASGMLVALRESIEPKRSARMMTSPQRALEIAEENSHSLKSTATLSEEKKRFALESLLKQVSATIEAREREAKKATPATAAKPAMITVSPKAKATTTLPAPIQARASMKERIGDPVEKMLRALGYGQQPA